MNIKTYTGLARTCGVGVLEIVLVGFEITGFNATVVVFVDPLVPVPPLLVVGSGGGVFLALTTA